MEQTQNVLLQGDGADWFAAESGLELADPQYFIKSRIEGVELAVENGKQLVRVLGQADADHFRRAELMVGAGAEPKKWSRPSEASRQADRGLLGQIPAGVFAGAKQWTIRLLVTHKNGSRREFRFLLNLG